MEQTAIADFFRGIIISASSLIIGFSLMTTFFLVRGRRIGWVYRTPAWVSYTFAAGYIILLFSVILARWDSIGQHITFSTFVAVVGLALNVISTLGYTWYIKEVDNENAKV